MSWLSRIRRWFLGPDPRDRAAAQGAEAAEDDEGDDESPDDNEELPDGAEWSDALDLHFFAPRDMLSAAQEHLEEAQRRGVLEVRLIHGRGKGVQRANVRRMLAGRSDIEWFGDAPAHLGGWGATVVRLRPRPGQEPPGAP